MALERVSDACSNKPLPSRLPPMLSPDIRFSPVGDQENGLLSGPKAAPIGTRIPTIDLVLLSVSLSLLLAVFTIGIRS